MSNYTKTATDVSFDYYGKQGKIDALETEHTRLLQLMASENTQMSDLILINTRLSQVDLELQTLYGELFKMDSLLEYSLVEITVYKTSYTWIWFLSIFAVLAVGGVTLLIVKQAKKRKKYNNRQGNNQTYPPTQSCPPMGNNR